MAPREAGPPGGLRLGRVARPTVGIGRNPEGEESKWTDSWRALLQASQALPPDRSSRCLASRSSSSARRASSRSTLERLSAASSRSCQSPPPAPQSRPRTGRKAGTAQAASRGRSARRPWSRAGARAVGSPERLGAPPADSRGRCVSPPEPPPRPHMRHSPREPDASHASARKCRPQEPARRCRGAPLRAPSLSARSQLAGA